MSETSPSETSSGSGPVAPSTHSEDRDTSLSSSSDPIRQAEKRVYKAELALNDRKLDDIENAIEKDRNCGGHEEKNVSKHQEQPNDLMQIHERQMANLMADHAREREASQTRYDHLLADHAREREESQTRHDHLLADNARLREEYQTRYDHLLAESQTRYDHLLARFLPPRESTWGILPLLSAFLPINRTS
ncbi:hypothetical protein BDN72DRAFT_841726 [Pluteus cervinus]|uniref:Uncharacterized protein n=1 Tax=Pluteus cervinus TaxID=181527 RepID=A0ACD3ASI5_9AGAR|nr:hypothetical protein BDN72DRAFT_841726 [Pluteus cervinus]